MANHILLDQYPLLQQYQSLRNQMVGMLTDDDLRYQPSGNNPTLGALCREMGETEYSYIQSFQTFKQDFGYSVANAAELEGSVAALTAWYIDLDRDLETALTALSDDDIGNRAIDRGGGFEPLPSQQLDVYKEALLIFYGKAAVYLRALNKPFPPRWQEWIG